MFCTNCGKKVPDESKFCPVCGNLLYKEEPTTVKEQAPLAEPSPKPELKPKSEVTKTQQTTTILPQKEETSNVSPTTYPQPAASATIEDVIGKNIVYYLSEFKKVDEGQKTKFNLAAFFLGLFFCFYRKCGDLFKKYFLIPVTILIVALIVLTIASSSFSLTMMAVGGILSAVGSIWAFISYIRFGKNFNKEYYAHCKAVLATGDKKKYGTSIGSAMMILAVVVVLSLIPSAVSFLSILVGSTGLDDFSGLDDMPNSSTISLDGEYAIVEDATSSEYIYLNFNWSGDGTLQISSSEDPTKVANATYKIMPTKDIIDGITSYAIIINNDYLGEDTEIFEFCSWTNDGTYYVRLSEPLAEGEILSGMLVPFTKEFGFSKNAQDNNYTENDSANFSNASDISGDWQDSWSQRCSMTITNEGNDYYSVDVIWATSASTYDEWMFSGYYDSSTGILSYEDGMWVSHGEGDIDGETYIVLDSMQGELLYDNGIIFWSDYTSFEYNMDFGSSEMRFEKW